MGRTAAPRIPVQQLDAWLAPHWKRATSYFHVEDRAKYEWYDGKAYGRCHLWDPGRIVLSRPHFRKMFLRNDAHFASQVVVHEILHGLGIEHDGRIGWSLAQDYPLDRELVDHIFHERPATKNAGLMLQRVERAWSRRDKLFCPGTMRAHAVRRGGAFCAMCDSLVADQEYRLLAAQG